MKKILSALLWFVVSIALAQSYPSPTYNNLNVNGTATLPHAAITGGTISGISPPIPVASGGTNSAGASGTALDNITGFSSTGFVTRTGAGAYSFVANPLPVADGGTGTGTVSGTALDNITGFSGTGFLTRTGAGAYSFQSLTNGITLANLAQQAANTVLANATGSTANVTAFPMPGCTASSSALGWASGSGFACNSSINAATLGGATFASPGPIGSGTANTGAFTTLSATSAPTVGAATLFPTVASNTALQALSTATVSTVTRLGYTTAGDSPALTYTASASACSLNAGAGDNGSQVQSSNGKCWLANFPPGPIDVREFGADPTGTNDSTTAIQAAANTGRVLYVHGYFKFTTITMTAGGIVGDGVSYSQLLSSDTTSANDITFSATNPEPGNNAPIFKDLYIGGQLSKTSGSGVYITAPSGENDGARFTNVMIADFPVDLQFGAAALWSITNCEIFNYSIYGVQVANTNNPDSGDSVITGSWFGTSVGSSQAAIYYQSSGGLRVIGDKMNGGAYGLLLALNSTSTSDLLINGNSIENESAVAIDLVRASGSGTFSNIEIVGNQFAGNPNNIYEDASGAFSNITVQGNVFTVASTAVGGITINSGVTGFNISGNVFYGNNGSTFTAIDIVSGATNGKIGKNTYQNVPVTLTNSSTTTFYERDKQIATATVTTSSAYGSLYAGSASVTFPTAFTVTPEVVCAPSTGGGGGVSAYATSVTKTGFTANAIGATSGGSVPVSCWAEGAI